MEEFIKLFAIAVIAAILISLLNEYNRSYAIVASVSICCAMLLHIVTKALPIFGYIDELVSLTSSEDFACIIKVVGIAILAQSSADICKDAGQTALSGKVVLAGRAAIIIAALPLFKKLINILTYLLAV